MLNKIISLILSVVISLLSFGGDSLKTVFNDTYSLFNERSDFLEDIDISPIDENIGYVKNLVLIFFEDDAKFSEKIIALKNIEGKTVGSLPDANLCVVATKDKSFDELTDICKEAELMDAVHMASVCPARKIEGQYTPNDPFVWGYGDTGWDESDPYGHNWYLEAIDARNAWGYSEFFEHINVGIIDSGFDVEHEELQGKIIFPSENEKNKNKVKSHGTSVAGIIAAKGDNEKGVYGICQNSTLIALNWESGWIDSLTILFGLGKVVKAGAKVVNMSVGSSGALDDDEWYWMNFLNDFEGKVFSYYMGSLLKKGYDFVVVQSSGNGNGPGHPVDCGQNGLFCTVNDKTVRAPIGVSKQDVLDRIIIVGACYYEDGEYIQSDYSNVGKRVDIVAPGDNIPILYTGGYTTTGGTSFSTPVVTSVASLVWSVNKNFTGKDVKRIVLESTEHMARPNDYYKFAEHLELDNLPVVNAEMAVEKALKETYDMNEIVVDAPALSEITFVNTQTNENFVFSTSSFSQFDCVLKDGVYDIFINDVIAVSAQEINENGCLRIESEQVN